MLAAFLGGLPLAASSPAVAASSSPAVAASSSTGGRRARPARPRVVLFGDSLASEAAPYFDWLVDDGGRATVGDYTFGGTAVCDWLPKIRQVADGLRPQVAVLEFSGDTFTPCMRGGTPESAATVARYCTDLAVAIGDFTRVHTHVYLVGTPVDREQWLRHDARAGALDRAIEALAARYPGRVTYVDAGRAVEGPHGSFVPTMPCLFFEPCTGPVVHGVRNDVVRSPDGVHFCPVETVGAGGAVTECPVYSSGAFRFAAAMATPILRNLRLASSETSAPGRRRASRADPKAGRHPGG